MIKICTLNTIRQMSTFLEYPVGLHSVSSVPKYLTVIGKKSNQANWEFWGSMRFESVEKKSGDFLKYAVGLYE